MNLAITLLALVGSAAAFAPQASFARTSMTVFADGDDDGPTLGSGGMADTRDPDAVDNEDPRKSISAAPSFEEYLKSREAEGN
mmetsp:Transcript_33109/g.39645  ORF Transcript_33109/g.39645 Transcript_33109/m.39645 type:complete len:83 (+) Transcript_33109:68-316(+)